MKRKIVLVLGTALLVITASCGPKRYGCNKRRCIANTNPTEKVSKPTTAAITKDA